jgi:hypothetical protein
MVGGWAPWSEVLNCESGVSTPCGVDCAKQLRAGATTAMPINNPHQRAGRLVQLERMQRGRFLRENNVNPNLIRPYYALRQNSLEEIISTKFYFQARTTLQSSRIAACYLSRYGSFSLLETITRESACGILPIFFSERLSESQKSGLSLQGLPSRRRRAERQGRAFPIRAPKQLSFDTRNQPNWNCIIF